MTGLETGMVCVKTKGREAGKRAVILEFDKGLAVIVGPNVKKRRCNAKHLIPTGKKLAIKKNATKKEIAKLLEE